jgi:hypothetical protein
VKTARNFEPGILQRLIRTGLVEKVPVFARPQLPMKEPLAIIRPGDQMPDCEALAYAGEKRLEEPRSYNAFRATQRAANIYGRGRRPDLSTLQVGHDIQLAAVHETYMRERFNDAFWFGEDYLATSNKLKLPKIPDALLCLWEQGWAAIEVIGDYPASRIREFLEAFRAFEITVELW